MNNYILDEDGKTPIKCNDFVRWSEWFENAERQIRKDLVGPYSVSTVFLGMDHGFGMSGGDPILWETMIFGGDYDRIENEYQVRSSSHAEALRMHDEAVEVVKKSWREDREKLRTAEARKYHQEVIKQKELEEFSENLTKKKTRKIIVD